MGSRGFAAVASRPALCWVVALLSATTALAKPPPNQRQKDKGYTTAEFGPWTERTLFGDSAAKPLDVRQGLYGGTCYLLAALAASGKVDPDSIRGLFARKINGSLVTDARGRPFVQLHERQADGTYLTHLVAAESRLPVEKWLALDGPVGDEVFVKGNGDPLYAQVVDGKGWAPAVELAYRDFRAKLADPLLIAGSNEALAIAPGERLKWEQIRGGLANRALEQLFGHDGGFREFAATPSDAAALFRNIEKGIKLRRPMVIVGTDEGGTERRVQQAVKSGLLREARRDWIKNNTLVHAYAVLATRTDPNGERFVQIFNPYRRSLYEKQGPTNLTKGIRWVPLAELATTFRELQFGRLTATPEKPIDLSALPTPTGEPVRERLFQGLSFKEARPQPNEVVKLLSVLGPDGERANAAANRRLIRPARPEPQAFELDPSSPKPDPTRKLLP